MTAPRYYNDATANFCADANLIAHWANLGYVEEAAIRNYILQSLITRSSLDFHQAFALIILSRLAGTTFEAYLDPSVVDRCLGRIWPGGHRGGTDPVPRLWVWCRRARYNLVGSSRPDVPYLTRCGNIWSDPGHGGLLMTERVALCRSGKPSVQTPTRIPPLSFNSTNRKESSPRPPDVQQTTVPTGPPISRGGSKCRFAG